MPLETAISAWQSLRHLAGDQAKVHVTGGEPFLYWEHLCAILEQAKREGLMPLDMIETDGFWATDEQTVIDRLKLLDELGMEKLKVSTDPFHQEFVDIEPVRRLARIGTDILGPERLLVRWRRYLDDPAYLKSLSREEKEKQYVVAINEYPCRFTGRAAGRLAELVASIPLETLSPMNCSLSFLGAKGVHIDPFGNVFGGTCSGIIVGNVNKTKLEDIWLQFEPGRNTLIETLFRHGPHGLLAGAVERGYKTMPLYAAKCHLCTHIRQFLFEKGIAKDTIGPQDCYSRPTGG
jgi:MoaA/NifB/PqqE/SkfB family radical SAM enzyme